MVGRVMYLTNEMDIAAIDAGTWKEIWNSHEDINLPYQHFPLKRGATYLGGRLFRGTQDGRVFGYDAAPGKVKWKYKYKADAPVLLSPKGNAKIVIFGL